jgi:hypothetical protein
MALENKKKICFRSVMVGGKRNFITKRYINRKKGQKNLKKEIKFKVDENFKKNQTPKNSNTPKQNIIQRKCDICSMSDCTLEVISCVCQRHEQIYLCGNCMNDNNQKIQELSISISQDVQQVQFSKQFSSGSVIQWEENKNDLFSTYKTFFHPSFTGTICIKQLECKDFHEKIHFEIPNVQLDDPISISIYFEKSKIFFGF